MSLTNCWCSLLFALLWDFPLELTRRARKVGLRWGFCWRKLVFDSTCSCPSRYISQLPGKFRKLSWCKITAMWSRKIHIGVNPACFVSARLWQSLELSYSFLSFVSAAGHILCVFSVLRSLVRVISILWLCSHKLVRYSLYWFLFRGLLNVSLPGSLVWWCASRVKFLWPTHLVLQWVVSQRV